MVEDIFLKHDKGPQQRLGAQRIERLVERRAQEPQVLQQADSHQGVLVILHEGRHQQRWKIDIWELYNFCLKNITPE